MKRLDLFKHAFVAAFIFYLGMCAFPYLAQAQTATGAPSLTVTAPQTGANLVLGATYHITWSSKNVNKVSIGYSSGPGDLNWLDNNASVNISNKGYYNWRVDIGNLPSSISSTIIAQIRICVIAYSSNGSVAVTSYSGYANVVLPSSAVLMSPAPNSTVNSSEVSFLWTPVLGATAYSLKVGSTAGGDDYENSGEMANNSTIGIIPQNGQKAFVTLSTLINGKWHVNQYSFSMATAVIAFTAPKEGESLSSGQSYKITWNSKNIDSVSIGWSSGVGNLTWIATSIPNQGYYNWMVNIGNTTNQNIRFYIVGYKTGVGSWENYSGNFIVLAPTLVELAEAAINNYFTVLLSGSDPSFALSGMNTAIKAVTNPLQVKEVQAYYSQQDVIYLYQYALKMIGLYTTTPNNTTLSTALSAVMPLHPYNSTKALSGLGLYDDALNLLMQAVGKNLPKTYNVASITPPSNVDGSFGTDVISDAQGNVFISAPSNAAKGNGVIYEFSKNSNNVWSVINQISPISPVAGDHFGREFKINNGSLFASSEPANGLARVYIFSLQSNNTWAQQSFLDLTTEANIKNIQKIVLATTFNTIVVGLPQYAECLIFNHVFDYSTDSPQTLISDRWSLNTESFAPGTVISDVGANGLYIAVGAQIPGKNGSATGAVFIYNGSIRVASVNSENEYTIEWTLDNKETGAHGYGEAVRINQDPALSLPIGSSSITSISLPPVVNQVNLAIGSPLENNGAGAVYTVVKSVNSATGQLVWADPVPLTLFMPTSTKAAGYELGFNGTTLMVSATNSSDALPALVMEYQLNSTTNQWSWAYSLNNSNPLYGSSLHMGENGLELIGSSKAANDKNSDDINQVIAITPINVPPMTSLVMQSNSGDYIGQGQNYNYTLSNATFNVTVGTLQSDGKVASINIFITSTIAPATQSWTVSMETTTLGQDLAPGVYTNAERAAFAASGHPGLDVYGEGRGSNTLTGQFTVINAKFDYSNPSNPKVVSFAASFVQHSEGAAPALNGTIYYNYSS